MSTTPVFLITGASSGFGEAIAYEALARGHHVIATARKASKLGGLQAAGAAVLDLDVTSDEATLAAILEQAKAIYGRITHVVNCAGYILEGAVEEARLVFLPFFLSRGRKRWWANERNLGRVSAKEVFDHYNTNVFGTFNIARAATPHLREAAKVPGQRAALVTFGSLGSWRSSAAIAHCGFLDFPFTITKC